MRTEMTIESLLELIEQSRVIDVDRIRQLADEFRSRRAEFDSPQKIADELVSREMLTGWQAEQLLQGKHRGFFLGPYRILDLLGSGGMGRVYLAEHQMMHRRCAIKVLPPKQSKRQASTVDRFYREAQAVAALDHPNIVQAYDVNKTRIDETEVHYLVMEYVDGQDFQKVVRAQGVLNYRQAADFFAYRSEVVLANSPYIAHYTHARNPLPRIPADDSGRLDLARLRRMARQERTPQMLVLSRRDSEAIKPLIASGDLREVAVFQNRPDRPSKSDVFVFSLGGQTP